MKTRLRGSFVAGTIAFKGLLFCNVPVRACLTGISSFKGLHLSSFSPFSHCETTRNTSALFVSAIG